MDALYWPCGQSEHSLSRLHALVLMLLPVVLSGLWLMYFPALHCENVKLLHEVSRTLTNVCPLKAGVDEYLPEPHAKQTVCAA
jgi:hypothetical protein